MFAVRPTVSTAKGVGLGIFMTNSSGTIESVVPIDGSDDYYMRTPTKESVKDRMRRLGLEQMGHMPGAVSHSAASGCGVGRLLIKLQFMHSKSKAQCKENLMPKITQTSLPHT